MLSFQLMFIYKSLYSAIGVHRTLLITEHTVGYKFKILNKYLVFQIPQQVHCGIWCVYAFVFCISELAVPSLFLLFPNLLNFPQLIT